MDSATNYRDDVGRVLIAGDTHGNTKWVKHLTEVAARNDCPVIIQVGDFGYFPDHRDGPRFLSAVDQACAANGVELWFIDGNHDDHTSLAELEHGHIPVQVAEHVTYLPRGTRLHVGGRTFGFLGGAFSVDWRDRTAGIDWWHHEVTDTDDVARLGPEQLDVLITRRSSRCRPAAILEAARRGSGPSRRRSCADLPLLGEWYATVMFWRPQVALFVSETTLLPVFVPLAPASSVIRRLPVELADVLRRQEVSGAFIDKELSKMNEAVCLPTASRSHATVGHR